jgi:hypothetical protein
MLHTSPTSSLPPHLSPLAPALLPPAGPPGEENATLSASDVDGDDDNVGEEDEHRDDLCAAAHRASSRSQARSMLTVAFQLV